MHRNEKKDPEVEYKGIKIIGWIRQQRNFIQNGVFDDDRVDLFNSIVMGKDVTETIHTSKGDFKVKYPRARDIQQIGKLQAYRLGGISSESFDKSILSKSNSGL